MESCYKTKHRDEEEKKKIINRINRLEGQIKGIKQMIEADRYCDDVIIQITAVNNSLKKIGFIMLENHMKSCMKDELNNGNESIIAEILATIERLK